MCWEQLWTAVLGTAGSPVSRNCISLPSPRKKKPFRRLLINLKHSTLPKPMVCVFMWCSDCLLRTKGRKFFLIRSFLYFSFSIFDLMGALTIIFNIFHDFIRNHFKTVWLLPDHQMENRWRQWYMNSWILSGRTILLHRWNLLSAHSILPSLYRSYH